MERQGVTMFRHAKTPTDGSRFSMIVSSYPALHKFNCGSSNLLMPARDYKGLVTLKLLTDNIRISNPLLELHK